MLDNCSLRHTCGEAVMKQEAGEWCETCDKYQHPIYHNWRHGKPVLEDLLTCSEAAERLLE